MLPELHPDELLLREASSTLTPREWADLSAHLARCPACALERSLRREAARLRVPSDLDHAIAARVVGRILAKPARPELHERDIGPGPAKRGASWGRRLAYAAIALVLISGTAMAGAALVVQIRQRGAARVESDSRISAPLLPAPKRRRGALSPAARGQAPEIEAAGVLAPVVSSGEPPLGASASPPRLAPEPAVAAVAPPSPARVALAPSAPVALASPAAAVGRQKGRGRSVALAVISRGQPPASAPVESPRADASTLLRQAEEAESAGRLGGASRLYDELGRSFPGTREEIVARALHGQLSLDRMSNPTRALALFESYLKAEPSGTLAEEARLGRARSLERLGRASEERSAWLDLLRAHPRSVHAAAARARLAALDGT